MGPQKFCESCEFKIFGVFGAESGGKLRVGGERVLPELHQRENVMFRYTCKVIIRKDRLRTDGRCPVCLQVFINGRRAVMALNCYVRPEWFDEGEQRVKYPAKVDRETRAVIDDVNLIISKEVARFSDITTRSRLANVGLSVEMFKEQFKNDVSTADFVTYVRRRIEKLKDDRARETIVNYNTFLKHLSEWRPVIQFHELGLKFVTEYDAHLRKKLGLSVNSAAKHLKDLKRFMNDALTDGIKLEYPFRKFKIKRTPTKVVYLTKDEVKRLILIPREGLTEKQQLSLRMFLFACFTGLRISDICELDNSMIRGDSLYITPMKTRKMKKEIRIPLTEMAKQFIQHHEGRMFDKYSKPHINKDLKEIAKKADPPIEKRITFHKSRHTFGASFMEAGNQIEVLKELLGHGNLSTTMIYAHITDQSRRESIDRMTAWMQNEENQK